MIIAVIGKRSYQCNGRTCVTEGVNKACITDKRRIIN